MQFMKLQCKLFVLVFLKDTYIHQNSSKIKSFCDMLIIDTFMTQSTTN